MPVFQLIGDPLFPPPELAREDGLLAVGGDLTVERLLNAYRMGIFPWYSPGEPILWWAPPRRLILDPPDLKISKKLARTISKKVFQVTMDRAFPEIITACSTILRKQGEGTWIDDSMIRGYSQLHDLGYAHSVECWQKGKLAGGLYGVSLGGIFFGESMFSRVTDSSKVALAALVRQLVAWDFDMIDCQISTPHLKRLGAAEIPADEFYHRLEQSLKKPTRRGRWKLEA